LTGTSQDDLVALVELVGLAGREDERHECRRTRRRMLLASVVVPWHRIIADRM
jgi:hypothetical protein